MNHGEIKPPKTYAEWTDIFDQLRDKLADEDVLEAMQHGSIEWQAGVAERFSKRLIDTINYRMNLAVDKFQNDMQRSSGQESVIVQALLGLRRELKFLSKAISIPALPEENSKQYYQMVLEQADRVQSSLENSAKRDRSGKLSTIVRNNRVNIL